MKILDIDAPRSCAHRVHHIAARKCALCGWPLEYFTDGRHLLPNGDTGTRVLLQCPACAAPPVEVLYIPVRGLEEDVIEENLSAELYMLAAVTVSVKTETVEHYRGVRLEALEDHLDESA